MMKAIEGGQQRLDNMNVIISTRIVFVLKRHCDAQKVGFVSVLLYYIIDRVSRANRKRRSFVPGPRSAADRRGGRHSEVMVHEKSHAKCVSVGSSFSARNRVSVDAASFVRNQNAVVRIDRQFGNKKKKKNGRKGKKIINLR